MVYPKISLILFTYNQEQYIRHAAGSCLRQDYEGPLEIIFSDDFSTDSSYELLQQLAHQYSGPHTVIVRRNTANLGIGAHYNAAIAESSGELIFTAAGDDISFPTRVSSIVNAWIEAEKKPDLLTSNLQRITVDGELKNIIQVSDLAHWITPEQWCKKRPYIVGAAHAFTRRLHETFGNFLPGVVYEDQVMSFRATLAAGGLRVDAPLVMYRENGVSQRKGSIVSGAGYLKWSLTHFSRQHAQYCQIQKDLVTAHRNDLWLGKIRRRLHDARLVLDLHRSISFIDRLKLIFQSSHSWWGFRVKHLVFLIWPRFAASVQKLQQKLK